MLGLYKKNIRILLSSVSMWISVILFLVINGFATAYFNIDNGFVYYGYTISNTIMGYVIIIPVLCMNAQKLTGSHTLKNILAGYFSLLSCLFSALMISFLSGMTLLKSNKLPMGEIILSLFGYFMFGAALTAVCYCINLCINKKLIAALIAIFAVCLFIFSGFFSDSILIIPVDFSYFLNPFINGILSIPSLLYYSSYIIFFIFLTICILKIKTNVKKSKEKVDFSTDAFITLILLLSMLFVNLLANSINFKYVNFDVTAEKLYSPDNNILSLVKELEHDIDIMVLNDKGEEDNVIGTLLRQLREVNDHIKVSYVPKKEVMNVMLRYTTEYLPYNSLIITDGNKSITLNYDDLYIRDTTDFEYMSVNGYFPVKGNDLQAKLASAIRYLMVDEHPVVYVSTGFSEYTIPNALINKVYNTNIELIYIDLDSSEYIPENAASLIIAGPLADLSDNAYEVVLDYLENGGDAIFLFSATTDEDMKNYESLAAWYGLNVEEGIVLETEENKYYMCQWYIIPELINSVVTDSIIEQKQYALFMYPKVISEGSNHNDATIKPILASSNSSFAIKNERILNITGPTGTKKAENEPNGPFYLALKADKKTQNGFSQAYIFASEFILDEEANSISDGANYSIFINALKDIVSVKDNISIEPKMYLYEDLVVYPDSHIMLAYILLVGILPVIMIIIAAFVSHLILKNDCGKIK